MDKTINTNKILPFRQMCGCIVQPQVADTAVMKIKPIRAEIQQYFNY